MKIGIMTFWWSEDNYGQLLQCYALQKYLRDKGHETYLIRYDPRNDYIKTSFQRKIIKAFNPVKLYKHLCYKLKKIKDNYEKHKNPRYFDNFRFKYIKQSEKIYYSYDELVKDPPEADAYIVGSDQVWNTFSYPIKKAVNVIKAYLLDFGNNSKKRIAYAASFGKNQLDNTSIEIFSSLLKKFQYISVREKSGLNICKQCGINNAEWVPDPTILLDINIYRSLYNDLLINTPDKAYCFLYILDNKIDFSIQAILDWVKKENLDVVYVTGNNRQDKYKKIYATIPEWIYLLEHAEYVITNSYHCCIFSILFKKNFAVRPHTGKKIGENNRLDSLFELFQIEKRYINSDLSIIKKEINWQSVSNILQNIRNNCKLPILLNSM